MGGGPFWLHKLGQGLGFAVQGFARLLACSWGLELIGCRIQIPAASMPKP